MAKTSFGTTDEKVRTMIRDWFTKLPALSPATKDIIVVILPWFALIAGVINAFRIISLLSPFLFGTASVLYLGTFIVGVWLIMAFFKLTRYEFLGWKYTYWAVLLYIFLALVVGALGNIIFGIIILYLLFQVESRYK